MYNNTVTLRNQISWMVYGIVCILVGIFAMGTCIQSSMALKFGLSVGSMFELVLIGVVCCEMFLMVSRMSDACV
jgi:hypothetical protein